MDFLFVYFFFMILTSLWYYCNDNVLAVSENDSQYYYTLFDLWLYCCRVYDKLLWFLWTRGNITSTM